MMQVHLAEVVVMRWRSCIGLVAAAVVGALLILGGAAAAERLQVPGVPERVRASDGRYTNKIRIDWGDDSMATSWKVYRAETENSRSYDLLTETTSRNVDDTDVVVGTTYWYKVTACNLLGCSGASDPESGFAQVTPPDVAPVVTASDGVGIGNVAITWTPVSRATEYEIYGASDASARTYELLATVPGEVGGMPLPLVCNDALSFGLGCRIVWYWVRGCNSAGCGPYSEPDSGFPFGMLPMPPGGVTVTASQDLASLPGPQVAIDLLTGPFARVTWAAVEGVSHYRVYRETILSTFVPGILGAAGHTLETATSGAALAEPTHTTFDDMDVAACQIYSYKVAACGDCGCGEYSQPVRWTPQVTSSPTGVQISQGGFWPGESLPISEWDPAYEVYFSWQQVSGATSYTVHAYDVGQLALDGSGEMIAQPSTSDAVSLVYEWNSDTTHSISYGPEIQRCRAYAYTVAACNCFGCGPESSPVLGWLTSGWAFPPVFVAASAGTYVDRIDVEWACSLGQPVTYFQVERADAEDGAYVPIGTVSQSENAGPYEHTALFIPALYRFSDTLGDAIGDPAARPFWYRVVAYRDCARSGPSLVAAGYTSGYQWQQPACSDVSAFTGDSGFVAPDSHKAYITVDLEFQACAGITRVELWRLTDGLHITTIGEPTDGWADSASGADWRRVEFRDDYDLDGAFHPLYEYRWRLCDAFGCSVYVDITAETPVK
jgi:fibronectin type 3 domain-containing protein